VVDLSIAYSFETVGKRMYASRKLAVAQSEDSGKVLPQSAPAGTQEARRRAPPVVCFLNLESADRIIYTLFHGVNERHG
jgi:hypothetical protein